MRSAIGMLLVRHADVRGTVPGEDALEEGEGVDWRDIAAWVGQADFFAVQLELRHKNEDRRRSLLSEQYSHITFGQGTKITKQQK